MSFVSRPCVVFAAALAAAFSCVDADAGYTDGFDLVRTEVDERAGALGTAPAQRKAVRKLLAASKALGRTKGKIESDARIVNAAVRSVDRYLADDVEVQALTVNAVEQMRGAVLRDRDALQALANLLPEGASSRRRADAGVRKTSGFLDAAQAATSRSKAIDAIGRAAKAAAAGFKGAGVKGGTFALARVDEQQVVALDVTAELIGTQDAADPHRLRISAAAGPKSARTATIELELDLPRIAEVAVPLGTSNLGTVEVCPGSPAPCTTRATGEPPAGGIASVFRVERSGRVLVVTFDFLATDPGDGLTSVAEGFLRFQR